MNATGWRWTRLLSYFPLAAIGLEIGWVIVLFMGLIFMVGDEPYTNTPAKERLFDLIAVWPSALGLVVGVVATAMRYPGRLIEWICLMVGTLGCAGLVWSFATGLIR